jgi:hypothetical protein
VALGLAGALAVVGLAGVPLASAEPLPAPGDAAWRPVVFPSIERTTLWTAVTIDGAPAWRASAACAASSLALAIEPAVELAGPGASSYPFAAARIVWACSYPFAAARIVSTHSASDSPNAERTARESER